MLERPRGVGCAAVAMALLLLGAPGAFAQTAVDPVAAQLSAMAAALESLRAELSASRQEAQALRQQVQGIQAEIEALRRAQGATSLAVLAEDHELLAAKVADQEQAKVESGSKYHARLSGMMLFNLVSTFRAVDNLDLPAVAMVRAPGDSGGAFTASARQSFLNLEVFGPTFGGARTAGTVAFDFFGGFTDVGDGLTAGHGRLRTATFSLDWENTSFMAGQEVPFFSPQTPSSLASVAYPGLASAGNLWVWTPQVRVEHHVTLPAESTLVIQAGVLDPLTGELPANEYLHLPSAGERSRQPAVAGRLAWQQDRGSGTVIGVGAYRSPQNWGFGRTVGAWAVTGDWSIPVGSRLTLSGELYRGLAIAGLGGGASPSVLVAGGGEASEGTILPLSSVGGWAQLNLAATPRLQITAAYGQDHIFRQGLNPPLLSAAAVVSRNASGFANATFHARSNVVFAVEYRHLWTTRLDARKSTAGHLSLVSGIIF